MGGLLAWLLTRSITRPLAVRAVDAVANGDLSQHIVGEVRDEIAQLMAALAHMNRGPHQMVTQVRESAESIGEQGRGFAVVASEVRSLAQRSAQAAKEIKGLIGNSVDKVGNGSRLVADAGDQMKDIIDSVRRVSDIVGEITSAASGQASEIGEVNSSISQLDQMTQQNSALVEQSAAGAESLKEQAQRLAQGVARFRLVPGSV